MNIGKLSLKKIFIISLVSSFCVVGTKAFASDNVLQAIQVNGVNDSYNIVLKSDDVAEVQKTVQAPNKMIINLKGIRASKSINTIYNDTTTVDSVVVEPINDDNVKISIQAQNVEKAKINFDSLKTPLGVIGNSGSKPSKEIVLSDPVNAYRPVYNNDEDENEGLDLANIPSTLVLAVKSIFKDPASSWMVTVGLFMLLILAGVKLFKGKDSEIKVGLSQSLKEREVELYKSRMSEGLIQSEIKPQISPTAGYGIRAYQESSRSPYVSSEIQRPRPALKPQSMPMPKKMPAAQINRNVAQTNRVSKPTMQAPKPQVANIDSMKFLESMTKIYERNGRKDLAQGIRSNMQKAKSRV